MSQVTVQGHGIDVTEGLRQCVDKYFAHVLHTSKHIESVHVMLTVEHKDHHASATVHVKGHEFFAKATSDDMYRSVHDLSKKLIRQIKDYEDKSWG